MLSNGGRNGTKRSRQTKSFDTFRHVVEDNNGSGHTKHNRAYNAANTAEPDHSVSDNRNYKLLNGTTSHLEWPIWMQSQLDELLFDSGRLNKSQSEPDKVNSWPQVVQELASILDYNGRKLPSGGRPADIWRYLSHNRAIVYICGGGVDLGGGQVTKSVAGDSGGDKLALIRPVFRSILVKANSKYIWPNESERKCKLNGAI